MDESRPAFNSQPTNVTASLALSDGGLLGGCHTGKDSGCPEGWQRWLLQATLFCVFLAFARPPAWPLRTSGLTVAQSVLGQSPPPRPPPPPVAVT